MAVLAAEHIASAGSPAQFPQESLPEVAFLGRSNVGKSTLLNALAGHRKLAFVSSTPGRTQSINFFRVGDELCLVDLPGYGYAKVPRNVSSGWGQLIESYLLRRRTLKLSILLLDSRRGWMDLDLDLKQWLEHHQRPYLVVATKVDKLNQKELFHGLAAIREHLPAGQEPMPFSAQTGRGARELWQAIWNSKTRP